MRSLMSRNTPLTLTGRPASSQSVRDLQHEPASPAAGAEAELEHRHLLAVGQRLRERLADRGPVLRMDSSRKS